MSPRSSVGSALSRRSGVLAGFGVALLVLASLIGGWWLGRQGPSTSAEHRSRQVLQQEMLRLRQQQADGQASDVGQRRLLQLLLALEQPAEATQLLEAMADQQPDRWSLRLLLAELRRDQNDRAGAEREVRQLLNLKSDRIEALQLMALLQLEQGRGAQAQTHLTSAYVAATKPQLQPQALPIGLILADLMLQRGQLEQADGLYRSLAASFPGDVRPVLARALLKQQQGNSKLALELIAKARAMKPEQWDARVDQVAASWGLKPLQRPVKGTATKNPAPTTDLPSPAIGSPDGATGAGAPTAPSLPPNPASAAPPSL